MLNNSKIYRAGYVPRVIFYSQSSKGHEYNYGNPVETITGKNSRHITQNCSAERKLFSNIKHHPLPNSKRTIHPDYENDPQIQKFNKAKKYKWKNSTMDYTLCENENKKFKPTIKIYDKKNKTSDELDFNNNNETKNINNKEKNTYSFYIKNKYDYNSEILNLPGGTKRRINDIKDDYDKNHKDKTKLNSTIDCFRKRDFNNSKIECLKSLSKNNNKSHIMRNNIINLTNKETSGYNSNTNEDLINNKNNITNNHDNNFKDINNKYKYEKIKKIKRKFFEESKINDENSHNYQHFNDQANNNGLFRNYVNDSFKNGNNDLITHYTRKRNMKSYNNLFNDIHQENSKYNLIKYYGNNYSKKNYTQFEIN